MRKLYIALLSVFALFGSVTTVSAAAQLTGTIEILTDHYSTADFKTYLIGQSVELKVTLVNSGDAAYTGVYLVGLADQDFAFPVSETKEVTVGVNKSVEFTVKFNDLAIGASYTPTGFDSADYSGYASGSNFVVEAPVTGKPFIIGTKPTVKSEVFTDENLVQFLVGTVYNGSIEVKNVGDQAYEGVYTINTIGAKKAVIDTQEYPISLAAGASVVLEYTSPTLTVGQRYGVQGWLKNSETKEGYAALPNLMVKDPNTGVQAVNATHTVDSPVYSLQGVRVGKASQLSTLSKGVYVVNGQKVLVR